MAETDNISKVLIITGGQIDEVWLKTRISSQDYSKIIAADHGLLACDRLGLSPDYIVGDFDSVPEEILNKYRKTSIPIKTFPREKDKTDTQIAIELALSYNAVSIELIGAMGSRFDHTLANVHLLLAPLQIGVEACILNMNNKIYLKKDEFIIQREEQYGDFVSLLPFTERVEGLTLRGFKYPLDSIIMEAGNSLGISNVIIADVAQVEFNKGILLVVESRD
ncbi:MAG TPA: thiamine diphosphokinase [Mobilitalea sp.]|nr:thiamine diphosphokinase [Mobilitalea sp.]